MPVHESWKWVRDWSEGTEEKGETVNEEWQGRNGYVGRLENEKGRGGEE